MSTIRVNDRVRVSRHSEALVEYRGKEGRVTALRAREAQVQLDDGGALWFYDWYLEPATRSPSNGPEGKTEP